MEDSSIGPICKKYLGIEERYASLTEKKLMSTAYMSTGFLRYRLQKSLIKKWD